MMHSFGQFGTIAFLVSIATVEPVDTITPRPLAKTIDKFVPIADLLNVIAGIQDQLPPLRVKVASFPVSPDSSFKSEAVVDETSTVATVQIEASPIAPIPAVTVQPTLAPQEPVTTSILPPVVPEVTTSIPVVELTTPAPTTVSSFPTVVNTVNIQQSVESFATPAVADITVPALSAIEITPQTIPVEVAAPQQQASTLANVIVQTNVVDSMIVSPGTSRLLVWTRHDSLWSLSIINLFYF